MPRKPRAVIEYRLYELPDDLPILSLTGERWYISDRLSSHLHFHNCLEIGVCHTESGFMLLNSERVPFTAGDITLVPRHLPHTTCSTQGCRSRWSYLYIDLERMLRFFTGLVPDGISQDLMRYFETWHLLSPDRSQALLGPITLLINECQQNNPDRVPVIRAYSLVLLLELERLARAEAVKAPQKQTSAFALQPALEYIRLHYMEHCTMRELAAVCHLSETHFRRLFLSVMGSTPLHFLNETRIRHACVALDTANTPITDIAQSVGMPSIASFNRNFQQMMGMSPREYRRSAGARHVAGQVRTILPYRGWTEAEEPDVPK